MLEDEKLSNTEHVIKEVHIDWGITDSWQINASNIPVKDIADVFTASNIEDVLKEMYDDYNAYPDELKNLTASEINQLLNIDTTTISSAQWGYVGSLDQGLATTNSPTFAGTTLTENLNMSNKSVINVESIKLNTTPTVSSPVEGEVWFNATYKVINVKTDSDAVLQVGMEYWGEGKNITASLIPNGSVVHQVGSDGENPTMCLADASSIDTAKVPIGICTVDCAVGAIAKVTLAGQVNDINTAHLVEGAPCYISDTTPGALTSTVPVQPSVRYLVGFCIKSHITDGKIWVYQDSTDNDNYFNGTFRESYNALVTSNGTTTITMSLERSNGGGGGDLTMQFTDGLTILDCTPAQTITLTNGTATVPVSNYVFIPKSTKVLTVNTTGFPTYEHIKVGYFLVQDPATVLSNGALINQNWNDHNADHEGQGHLSHVAERIRRQGALYFSGFNGNGTSDYLTIGTNTVYFKMEGGVIYQMHKHVISAFDQSTGDKVIIINDPTTPYKESTNLFTDITTDSGGNSIGLNKYFNLVFWGVGNKTGEFSPIVCNLPSGFYNGLSDAENDVLGYDNFDLPREFSIESSTGFLICRITVQMKSSNWIYNSTVDLRGTTAQTATGGGSGTAITSFNDSTFDIHNLTDPSKELNFDASGISTLNTRIWTIQDKNITVAGTDDVAVVQSDVDGFPDFLKNQDQEVKTTDSPTFVDLTLSGGNMYGPVDSTLNIRSDGDVAFWLDRDNDGSNAFRIYNSASTQVFYLNESGTCSILGDLTLSGGDIYGPTDSGLRLRSDTSIALYLDSDNDGSDNFLIINGNGTTVFDVDESGNTDILGDLTVSGNTLTFGNGESINNVTDGYLKLIAPTIQLNGDITLVNDYINLYNSGIDRTLYIYNSHPTYQASLNVEKDLIVGNDVTINGGLNVLGTFTTINTQEVLSENRFIFENEGYTGSGVPGGVAGTIINMGTENDIAFLVNSTTKNARVGEYILDRGDVVSATSTTIVLDANASVVDDVYNGKVISVYKEGETTQHVTITDYVGLTKTATVASWGTQPDSTWNYQVERTDNTLAIAARPESGSLTNGGIAYWNASSLWYETDANLTWDGTSLIVNRIQNASALDFRPHNTQTLVLNASGSGNIEMYNQLDLNSNSLIQVGYLGVSGDILLQNTSANAVLRLRSDTGDSYLHFNEGATQRGSMYYDISLNWLRIANTTSGDEIRLADAGGIFTTGNFGIGGSPSRLLHIQSGTTDIMACFQSTDAGAEIAFTDNTGSTKLRSAGGSFVFYAGGDASSVTAGNSVNIATIGITGLNLLDNKKLNIGTGNDLEIYHDGTNNKFNVTNGILHIDFGGVTKSYFSSTAIVVQDNISFSAGNGGDLIIKHDSSNSFISNSTGSLYIDNISRNIISNSGGFLHDLSGSFQIRDSDDSDVELFDFNTSTRTLNIGGSSDNVDSALYGKVEIDKTFTNTTGDIIYLSAYPTITATATKYNNAMVIRNRPHITTGVSNTGYSNALFISSLFDADDGGGSLTDQWGAWIQYGINSGVNSPSITNSYGINLNPYAVTGSITNLIGLRIGDESSGGTVTNAYGIYMEEVDVGTTKNYAIYSKGGDVYFGGNNIEFGSVLYKIGYATDTFTYDSDTLLHYGITGYNDSVFGGGAMALSGYYGLRLFDHGGLRASFTNTDIDFVTTDFGVRSSTSATESQLKLQAVYDAVNGCSSRVFFNENYGNNLYGFSWIFAGTTNPTIDGTAFSLTGNKFYLMNHENSLAGSKVLEFDRATGEMVVHQDATFNGDVDIVGLLNFGDGIQHTERVSFGEDFTSNYGVKQHYIGDLVANSANAYRYEIMRVGHQYAHWDVTSEIKIKVYNSYPDSSYKEYWVDIGYNAVENLTLRNVVGATGRVVDYRVVLGAKVLVSTDYYYYPVYVEVDNYTHVSVLVEHSMPETTDSTPTGGIYFPTPTASSVSSFADAAYQYIGEGYNDVYVNNDLIVKNDLTVGKVKSNDHLYFDLDVASKFFYWRNSANEDIMYLDSSGNLTVKTNIEGVNYVDFQAQHGYGIRFWDSDSYKIYMSGATQTGAGRVTGDTTSDYNMYFRMTGATNRGFAFQTSTSAPFFSINPDMVRSSVGMSIGSPYSAPSAGNLNVQSAIRVGTTSNYTYIGEGSINRGGTANLELGENVDITGALTLGSSLAIGYGGTGKSSWTQYGLVYASATTTLSQVAIGTAGQVLSVNGTANGYTWVSALTNPYTGDMVFNGNVTISGNKQLTVEGDADTIILKDSSHLALDTDYDFHSYIRWTDSGDNIQAFVGYGSASNSYFYIQSYGNAYGTNGLMFNGWDAIGFNIEPSTGQLITAYNGVDGKVVQLYGGNDDGYRATIAVYDNARASFYCYDDNDGASGAYKPIYLGHSSDTSKCIVVDGNDGDITIPSRTRYYSLPGYAFKGNNPDINDVNYTSSTFLVSAGSYTAVAPVNLPHGATVTHVVVYGNSTETWYLKRTTLSTSADVTMASATLSNADTSISYSGIDNQSYAYLFEVPSLDINDRIYGARITYTVTSPYP